MPSGSPVVTLASTAAALAATAEIASLSPQEERPLIRELSIRSRRIYAAQTLVIMIDCGAAVIVISAPAAFLIVTGKAVSAVVAALSAVVLLSAVVCVVTAVEVADGWQPVKMVSRLSRVSKMAIVLFMVSSGM